MTISNTFKPQTQTTEKLPAKIQDTAKQFGADVANGADPKAAVAKLKKAADDQPVRPRMTKKERAAMLMKAADAAAKKADAKPHDAEIAELAHFPKATGFIASVFIGSGKFAKRETATPAEARAEGLKLAGVHGKKALIYAQLPEGLPYKEILIPDTFRPQDVAATAPKENDMAKKAKAPATKGKAAAKPAAPAAITKPSKAAKAAPHRHDEAALSGAKARRGGLGKSGWRAAEEAAKAGKMPPYPDFSAPTHNSYRKKAEIVHALAKERDLKALQKFDLPRKDSTRTAIMRYRDLCITAIKAAGKAA